MTTVDTTASDDLLPLDNTTWNSLTGPHRSFAERHGKAVRFQPDVAPFWAVSDLDDPAAWHDLAELACPGETVVLPGRAPVSPDGWAVTADVAGVQMIGDRLDPADLVVDSDAVVLGPADVPEMLDLVERTQPGPFRKRTVELGTYLGVRRDGALIAMAGERLRVPGWTEISAVCTDPVYRGEGLGSRLVRSVAAGILDRGERPFLHTGQHNTTAISLYRTLGFSLRLTLHFRSFRVPG